MKRSEQWSRAGWLVRLLAMLVLFGWLIPIDGQSATSNAITVENAKAGNPASQWDISGAGDSSIQGFATQISVNKGETVRFKVKTTANSYRIDIYRLGYYNGAGARLVTSVVPTASLPQNQPNPLTDSSTGLVDCGNWAESASWAVPSSATTGVYLAKLVRTDNGGASHMVFVVRDDAGNSDVLFQTSDTTWQAYNSYGGNSLYVGSPAGRAYKVSYNRPFNTRAGQTSFDWLFNAEYPMIRWLEANGYNVSYSTGVDSDLRGNLIPSHRVFLSVGHDEYWSANQRSAVEAARAAGVHLGFFSGNECFWKTRWEPSIDASATAYRTLVCYKETHAGAKIDPNPAWTGTWRDPRFSPPADGGRPENALTGTLFVVNSSNASDRISVSASYGAHWFWRNSGIDTLRGNSTADLAVGTLGYEWDHSPLNGVEPFGLQFLSSTTISGAQVLLDYGSSYGDGSATHRLTLYRHNSGAWVFGAGTVQWSWGLDSQHDNSISGSSVAMQQATVNLLANMQVQPGNLQSGLVPGVIAGDGIAPTSTIQSPASGSSASIGVPVTISGIASDSGGGIVAGVQVSVDGGVSWQSAGGTTNWSYGWTPAQSGSVNVRSRAVDDSGNLETPGAGINLTVSGSQGSIWSSSAVPGLIDGGADSSVEIGVKFRSDTPGRIKGVRFYKSSANTGPHVGNLWSNSGTRLATATFAGESASGWQQVNFATPVSITANTVYVVSYHANTGHYSADLNFFATKGVDAPPLHLLANGVSGGNGVYSYGSTSSFPNQSYNSSNYWVDLVYEAGTAATLQSIAVSPLSATVAVGSTQQFVATGTYSDSSTQNISNQVVWTTSNSGVASINSEGLASGLSAGTATLSATASGVSGSATLSVQVQALTITTTGLANGFVGTAYSASLSASGGATPYNWSISSGALPTGLSLNASTGAIAGTPSATGTFNFTARVSDSSSPASIATKSLSVVVSAVSSSLSIWPASAVPSRIDSGPDKSVELGLKFRSEVAGKISGIRYYKASTNTGTHTGNLWSNSGSLLATANFTSESTSGWQQVTFASPVNIEANTVYVASYHTSTGHYSVDQNYFASAGVDNPPLHALAAGVSGENGVFAYGATSVFPNQSFRSSNYWVDVVFQAGGGSTSLSVSTASLPSGTVNLSYSATLSASGGTNPYVWSIAAGALPTGLSLNASTGGISGSPTVAGTFNFTVRVTDGSSPAQTVTKALSIVVGATAANSSFWSNTTVPGVVDGGADSSVELGIRFFADTPGFITGIRFYKSNANTGTHIGSLWSSAGTLLASATFVGESASGWQQVTFGSPIAINANVAYVASYHANTGHYSADQNYFLNTGLDNGPLHAPAGTASSGNGVYRYGASSLFPNQSWFSSNYWVDVIFHP